MSGESATPAVQMAGRPRPAIVGIRPILITGGAGFIGSNLADRLASEGHDVLIYDSLVRPDVEENVISLRRAHPRRISAMIADVRDRLALDEAAARASAVFHMAAQVAVTTSMAEPQDDFDVNVGGTLALLEALRRRRDPPPIIFASTNKVYGDLADIALQASADSYQPADEALRRWGISEACPLSFHTPYGCSKGAADQYVLDYGRSFGIPSAVLRMSCIYGRRQRGTEDQGWVAHFLLRALRNEPITIYGDGRQVRDVLWIDDAIDAYVAAWRNIGSIRGHAFNLGGGPANAVSLLQVVAEIAAILGVSLAVSFADWRPGDQRYFVADRRRVTAMLGLSPPLDWRGGLAQLAMWFIEQQRPLARPPTEPEPAMAKART